VLRVVEGIDRIGPLDGGIDKGADRDEHELARSRLCKRHPWCIEADGHAGHCTLKDGHTLYEPTHPEYR
jgi:hypothetical protein